MMMMHSPLKLPKNSHSVTSPSSHILLGYDSLQCQHNNIAHIPGQKLLPPGKEYLCFQMDGKSAHAAQCSKSRSLTKVFDLTPWIGSFEQKCVISK